MLQVLVKKKKREKADIKSNNRPKLQTIQTATLWERSFHIGDDGKLLVVVNIVVAVCYWFLLLLTSSSR